MRKAESRIAAVLLGLVLVLFLGWQFGVSPSMRRLRELESKVPLTEERLKRIRDLQREWKQMRGESSVPRARTVLGSDLMSFVEKEIKRSGVEPELSYKEGKGAVGSDERVESRVEVLIKRVELSRLLDMIYGIESSPHGFRVSSLQIKAIGNTGQMLRADFNVSALTGEP